MIFEKRKLGDIYTFQYGTGNTIEDTGGDYPIYGSNGPVGFTDKYNSEDSPVIGHIGAYAGIVNWAPGKHFVTYNGVICTAKNGVDKKFAYYTLLNANLTKRVRGSTQPFVSYDLLQDVDILLPEINQQYKISEVLSSIDDKIATNNKIIETSKKLMREIYDYWFVQFDFPDENGRPYKSSGGEMVYDETLKREIPKEWSVVQLRDIAGVKSGFSFSSDDYISDGEYKIITIKNVQDGFIDYDIDNTIDFIPHKMPAWCKLGSSEILMSLTGNTGRIGLTFGEQALLNQRVAKIQPKDKAANLFLYVLLRSDSVQDKIQGLSSGSSQKNLSPIQLSNIYVAYSEEYSDKVSELLAPSVEIIVQKYSENRKLASLRDWLLPMLMNGQVKVKDK